MASAYKLDQYFCCNRKGLVFNVLSLAYADSSPICWHGIKHGTLVARGHSGWAAGCGVDTLCKQEALTAARHLLAVQHLSLLLQWGSLQSMGCDGKPSLVIVEARGSHILSLYPWQMEHAEVSKTWPNGSCHKKTNFWASEARTSRQFCLGSSP